MGYPKVLGGITRVINDTTTIHSTKFSIFDTLNIGARTAIIKLPDTNKLVIWSSIPVGEELKSAIGVATNGESDKYQVVAAIVPDIEHTLATIGLKKLYPSVILIGPSGIKDKPDLKLDYEFQSLEANKVVKGSSISNDLKSLDFVFLNGHKNKEVVTYDKTSHSLFTADLLFNVPWNGKNEDQYPSINQNAGWSGYISRALNPDSFFGRILMRKFIPNTEENKQGLRTIYNEFDFDTVVLSHGNIIDKDAKKQFKKVFEPYLS